VVDGNAVLAPEAMGCQADQEGSRRSPTSCGRKWASIPGAIAFPSNPPSLGQSFRSRRSEFIVMAQVPLLERCLIRAASHRRPLLEEARK